MAAECNTCGGIVKHDPDCAVLARFKAQRANAGRPGYDKAGKPIKGELNELRRTLARTRAELQEAVCIVSGLRTDTRRLSRTADREKGALTRVQTIAGKYGLGFYHQGDPRGCAVYLLRPGDVPEGKDPSAYYSRGVGVCS